MPLVFFVGVLQTPMDLLQLPVLNGPVRILHLWQGHGLFLLHDLFHLGRLLVPFGFLALLLLKTLLLVLVLL